jgi:hypothetical protein
MTPEQYQRSYLLPPGCKDLIDVLRLQELQNQATTPPAISGQAAITGAESFSKVWKFNEKKLKPAFAHPGFFLEVTLAAKVTVTYLASLLGRTPFQVAADLMELGVFATTHEQISFDDAARLLRKYGLSAKRRRD